MTNGNGLSTKILMWAIGAIFTLVCVIALPTLAKSVIENDRLRAEGDKVLDTRLDGVETDIQGIKTDLVWIKSSMQEQRTMTKEGFSEIKELIKTKI